LQAFDSGKAYETIQCLTETAGHGKKSGMIRTRFGLAMCLALFPSLMLGGARAGGVSIRIDKQGFQASDADIAAVCGSAAECLTRNWKEPLDIKVLVVKGKHGPFTAFKKNARGESVVQLDTGGTYWSQYAYQFSHELCHVLCAGSNDYRGNLWFEETMCETASLYCLRRMSEEWRTKAPYPNWKGYAPKLADYARNVVAKRTFYPKLIKSGLPAFYKEHRARLEAEPCDRSLNGAMAIVLLTLFERDPSQWEAIRWLNPSPSPKGETFQSYLKKWHDAAPKEHRAFIAEIANIFGVAW
jgi:hypothetical protein